MPVCISGMHRSGTSMVAQVLQQLGLYLGDKQDLLPATTDNSDGYFENRKFVRINQVLLEAIDAAWDRPTTSAPAWDSTELSPLRTLAAAIEEEFSSEPWGWKDPRNSLTAGYWKCVFPGLQHVVCLRNPLDVALSLQKRSVESRSASLGLDLWKVYNENILAATDPSERLVTHYDSYFENAGAEIRRLVEFIGMEVDRIEIDRVSEVIMQTKRNYRFSWDELVEAGIDRSILELYADLSKESGRSLDSTTTDVSSGSDRRTIGANQVERDLNVANLAGYVPKTLYKLSDEWLEIQAVGTKHGPHTFAFDDVTRSPGTKAAAVLHLFYPGTWQLFAERLSLLADYPADLYVTLPGNNLSFADRIKESFPEAHIFEVPNHGRDVMPFIRVAAELEKLGYEYVLKLHSKKFPHRRDGTIWLSEMVDSLLPADRRVLGELIATLEDSVTSVIGPKAHYLSLRANFKGNKAHIHKILTRIFSWDLAHQVEKGRKEYGFFGGTTFWARLDSIRPILEARFGSSEFEEEAGQLDGTLAHGLERAFCLIPEINGREIYGIDSNGLEKLPYASDRTYAAARPRVPSSSGNDQISSQQSEVDRPLVHPAELEELKMQVATLAESVAETTGALELASQQLAARDSSLVDLQELIAENQQRAEAAEAREQANRGRIDQLEARLHESSLVVTRLASDLESRERLPERLPSLIAAPNQPSAAARNEDWTVIKFAHRLEGQLSALSSSVASLHDAIRHFAQAPTSQSIPSPDEELARYRKMMLELRTVVSRVIPQDARSAIISRGDPALVDLLGSFGQHFPQDSDGSYSGYHPADASSAIAQLEFLQIKGIEYFVIPSSASWWLDHYSRFGDHLKDNYQTVFEEADVGIIYSLNGSQMSERPPRVEEVLSHAETLVQEQPALLDLKSGLDLGSLTSRYSIFSPPAKVSSLAYAEGSVDVVAVGDRALLAEARRIARHAIVNTTENKLDSFDVEWLTSSEHHESHLILVVSSGLVDVTKVRSSLPSWSRAKVAELSTKSSVVRAINRRIRTAEEDIAFLILGASPMGEFYSPMVWTLSQRKDAGAICAKIFAPDGSLYSAGGSIDGDDTALLNGQGDPRPDDPAYGFVRRVDFCPPGIVAFRRSSFLSVGGFVEQQASLDETFADLGRRMNDLGSFSYYQPEANAVRIDDATSSDPLPIIVTSGKPK